jgi:release factor glutamine methyltransferase
VPTDDIALMPPEARDHEPRAALDGGSDGLDILRRVVLEAPPWLSPAGVVLVEVSEQQAPHLVAAAQSIGRTADLVTDDEIGGSVLVIGERSRDR